MTEYQFKERATNIIGKKLTEKISVGDLIFPTSRELRKDKGEDVCPLIKEGCERNLGDDNPLIRYDKFLCTTLRHISCYKLVIWSLTDCKQ